MNEDREYLRICGKRLGIAWLGPAPKDAPTLIFLHEGFGCVDMWHDFPAKLSSATGCRALVYSRLGYGHSPHSEQKATTLKVIADFILSILH